MKLRELIMMEDGEGGGDTVGATTSSDIATVAYPLFVRGRSKKDKRKNARAAVGQKYIPGPLGIGQGVFESSLEELANTSLKTTEPRGMYNVNDRKQTTYKLFKFKSGKDTFIIKFTVKGPPSFGKKQNWNAVNVAFGVKEEQDDYSFGDEMDTDLTARNKNQFLIYSTVINTIRKFITEYNTEIDEIIMQGAGERQEAMYQRFFQSAGKYFPGWHYDGKHSLVRDVPRKPVKKVKEQGVAEAEGPGRVDPILYKALARMTKGGYDDAKIALAIEFGLLDLKNNYAIANNYIPKLVDLYNQKHSVAEGSLNEFAPGAGDEGGGEDPYKYPKPKHFSRSIDFFGQFEAEHFDREDMNDATGEFKGYWGKTQIAYFKFDNPEKTGGNDPGMGWYYEPTTAGNNNDTEAKPAVDMSAQRKQQELSMIRAFLKSGQTPKPGSQIYSLMKRHGMAEAHVLNHDNVIYRLDRENPMSDTEVLVLGGAGRYSLKALRDKARREAAELAQDLSIEHGGAFRRSATNIKQLTNTINTIVAAYNELARLRRKGGRGSRGITDEDANFIRECIRVVEQAAKNYQLMENLKIGNSRYKGIKK